MIATLIPPPKILSLSKAEQAFIRLFTSLRAGTLQIFFPSGQSIAIKGSGLGVEAQLYLASPDLAASWRRDGAMAILHSYQQGKWDSPDLLKLFYLFFTNLDVLDAAFAHRRRSWWRWWRHSSAPDNAPIPSVCLGANHDASGAIFPKDNKNLAKAQEHKRNLLLTRLEIKPEEQVLEIGCGRGALAELIITRAEAGYTGVVASQEDWHDARKRLGDLRYKNRQKASIRFHPFWALDGRYDAIAMLETLESVAVNKRLAMLRCLKKLLRAKGRLALQTVLVPEEAQEASANNGLLSLASFPGRFFWGKKTLEKGLAGVYLTLDEPLIFNRHYAQTLRTWRDRLPEDHNAPHNRGWALRLAALEAAFLGGQLQALQATVRHTT
ncbi:MAG: SAM-dependent methyltransferase [Holosporales bacterium]|jgi:cyclopropane-fatty-acyl-phospholipid synthase